MCGRKPADGMCGVRSPGWLGGGCESSGDGSADKCASIHGRHFTPSRKKGNRDSVKKGAVRPVEPPLLVEAELEIKPQTELHASPIMRVFQMQEVTRAKALADGVKLCVIKQVEGFPTEVESGPLVNREALEGTEIEV